MGKRRGHRSLSLLVIAALLTLLAVLATLQYHWLGQVSQAEHQRMRTNLVAASERFAEDFDAEITGVFAYFFPVVRTARPQWEELCRSQFDLWLEQAPHPELIRDILVVGRAAESGFAGSR